MSAAAPLNVYLDTDVLVNHILGGLPDSKACYAAVQRIAESRSIVFMSIITRMEFAQAVRLLATRRQLPKRIYDEFALDQWSDRQVRRRWLLHWQQEFEAFMSAVPLVVELPLSSEVVNAAIELMANYALRSHDDVHAATALHYGIPEFWACDDHFNRIDGVAVEITRD